MQRTPDGPGARVEFDTSLHSGEAICIIPIERPHHKHHNWLKIVRAFRSEDDWKLVYRPSVATASDKLTIVSQAFTRSRRLDTLGHRIYQAAEAA